MNELVILMALQLADSTLPTTRQYWRRQILGLPQEIADDPRPLSEIGKSGIINADDQHL
jgi:hypothetical protein